MSAYIVWAVVGLVLIIVELMTGTLYLLVVGVAALAAALVAYLGGGMWTQVMVAAVVTLLGVYLVNRWWKKSPKHSSVGAENLDVGQTVVLESWTDQSCGMARVRYRGTSWDAKVVGTAAVNDTLVIRALQNGAMEVSSGK